MHYAKIENSERLQRALKLLKKGGRYTTRQIIRKAHVCAVNSVIDEIRENGYNVPCKREKNIWYYELV